MAGFEDKNGISHNAYVTGNKDTSQVPILWKWAIQGKIFEAGAGLEDTAIAAYASVNDQYPTFVLQSPVSTSKIIMPIIAKVGLHNDGSALTEVSVCVTKPAALCATALTVSGTAFTSKHSVYRSNPAQTAQTATATYTNTLSALTNVDFVEYHRLLAIDAALTSGLPNMGGSTNVFTARFLDAVPHFLTSGAALLIYVKNGTTDATSKCYLQWAELTENDLI